jgi:hypothetical protein
MRSPVFLYIVVLLSSLSLNAADQTKINIEPGPLTMSAEERSITANPEQGAEHGVILIEETDRNEDMSLANEVTYHMRAKILSNEGRSLADITIPFNSEDSKLKEWWARTILPDGEVLELAKDELEEQILAELSSGDYAVLKGTLPGVVPGCVIDYGYRVRVEGFISPPPIKLQRAWPVKELRYRWKPWGEKSSAYFLVGGDRVDIDIEQHRSAFLIRARDISPVVEEPHMPPDAVVRAGLYLYYTDAENDDIQEYWKNLAKLVERWTKDFYGSRSLRRSTIEAAAVPADADLQAKLRHLYDWLEKNIENTSLRSAEEDEAAAAADEKEPESAKQVMKLSRADSIQIAQLFVGLARELGAEANIVLAVDRTENYWQPQMRSLDQFAAFLVGLQLPGDAEGSALVIAPGSGLPYGQVPWWLSGVRSLMATEDGAETVFIPVTKPTQNVYQSAVEVSFVEDNEIIEIDWSQSGTGQAGYSEKRRLRGRTAENRDKRLRKLCGESADLEVVSAESPGLETLAGGYQLSCTCEVLVSGVDEAEETFRYQFSGPWIRELPDLTAENRVHQVTFNYPYVVNTAIDIEAPEGFVPRGAPAPISIDSPLGNYRLSITETPTGYRVERMMALSILGIKAEGYPFLLRHLNAIRQADRTELVFERITEAS